MVYFALVNGGFIKVGYTAKPIEKRLAELELGRTAYQGARLLATAPGGRRTERRWHRRFDAHRVNPDRHNGPQEMYAPSAGVLEAIRKLQTTQR